MSFYSWQAILRQNIRSLQELITLLELTSQEQTQLLQNSSFPINIPRRIVDKMKKRTLDDPLFRQFVPLQLETKKTPGFVTDPVQDCSFQKTGRLLQKYEGRVLIIATGSCAMNCRFCFRQNYPYEEISTSLMSYDEELSYISSRADIDEVILSGGDPLSNSNRQLEMLLSAVNAIPHVQRIRFHTRFPIGIPERLDDGFIDLLKKSRCQIIFVLHINHPNELDHDIIMALQKVKSAGAVLLSQTVLLQGVNDSATTLCELYKKLGNFGVTSYYLHQLDPIQGAQHFEVSKEIGLKIIEELQSKLPGYLVPKYVQEIPGKPSKTTL